MDSHARTATGAATRTVPRTVLVTGGAGFIGSALVRHLLQHTDWRVITLDKLTYAGSLASLDGLLDNPRHQFVHGDIADAAQIRQLLDDGRPDGVFHLAAESHVDRSIDEPGVFITTNVVGTYTLLQETRRYWEQTRGGDEHFRFLHVSTDEVFGDLGEGNGKFTSATPYAPRSPYSASKAASDHLVRAWSHTYQLPVVITNCSNNYGPNQFPEKLIPLMILNAADRLPMPVYGDGGHVRDWLYVGDHVRALHRAFERGVPGSTYLIGGHAERTNLDVVYAICEMVDNRLGVSGSQALIRFVEDRRGHDRRYAIDAKETMQALGWMPLESFETGLERTVEWYLTNRAWCDQVTRGSKARERIGLGMLS